MPIADAEQIVQRLREFQRKVRRQIIESRAAHDLREVKRSASADTIYTIDAVVDPLLEAFCEDWGRHTPLILIAEGMEDEAGTEGPRVFPAGARREDAVIQVIVDPIDGTRGLMYDKRPAWALAGVAPNLGPGTRLRDIEIAVMTELPTSKMGYGDVLWAVKGQGVRGQRQSMDDAGPPGEIHPAPSRAEGIDHGFASVSNFFPGTKVLASQLMERIARSLVGEADVSRATVFDDQYICTGGQFYELIMGHDRFAADLRPAFYRMQHQPQGLCCHPYDCSAWLIAREAGVILTDAAGKALDGPMDTVTGLDWIGYANAALRCRIEPVILSFLRGNGS